MVDSVAKPHLLQIFLEGLEVRRIAVPLVVGEDILQKFADLKVVSAVLVPDDVASGLGGLRQVVDHFFLVERETVELGHFVAEHLDVGKPVDMVVEILVNDGMGLDGHHGADDKGWNNLVHGLFMVGVLVLFYV